MEIKRIIVGSLQTNCYLLVDGGELAVIDPGDDALAISRRIDETSAVVKFIINTHNHFDHVGANAELKKKYGAPIVAGAKEVVMAGFSPEIKLSDGQSIKIGGILLKVMETPGHTPGGICLFGPDFVISGDTLFDGSIGRTDLPGGSDARMAVSLENLDRLISEGATVYPGHGDVFRYKKDMVREWIDYLR